VVYEAGGRAVSGGWFSRWRTRVDVDPQLPALLVRILDRLDRYLDEGGLDAPTWVTEMGALERQLTHLTAGTRDRPLHGLLRELLRQMSAVYACAPGVDLHPHLVATDPLFDAMEAAEAVTRRALRRAAELQADAAHSQVPA
jgi:hypothetical protein